MCLHFISAVIEIVIGTSICCVKYFFKHLTGWLLSVRECPAHLGTVSCCTIFDVSFGIRKVLYVAADWLFSRLGTDQTAYQVTTCHSNLSSPERHALISDRPFQLQQAAVSSAHNCFKYNNNQKLQTEARVWRNRQKTCS